MIKHKPNPITDVKIKGIIYKCKNGILELPEAYPRFNPVEVKKKQKEVEED